MRSKIGKNKNEKVMNNIPTSRRCTQESHLFFQYGCSLKINRTSTNNSGQIGKQILHLCTSAECRVNGLTNFNFKIRYNIPHCLKL